MSGKPDMCVAGYLSVGEYRIIRHGVGRWYMSIKGRRVDHNGEATDDWALWTDAEGAIAAAREFSKRNEPWHGVRVVQERDVIEVYFGAEAYPRYVMDSPTFDARLFVNQVAQSGADAVRKKAHATARKKAHATARKEVADTVIEAFVEELENGGFLPYRIKGIEERARARIDRALSERDGTQG